MKPYRRSMGLGWKEPARHGLAGACCCSSAGHAGVGTGVMIAIPNILRVKRGYVESPSKWERVSRRGLGVGTGRESSRWGFLDTLNLGCGGTGWIRSLVVGMPWLEG